MVAEKKKTALWKRTLNAVGAVGKKRRAKNNQEPVSDLDTSHHEKNKSSNFSYNAFELKKSEISADGFRYAVQRLIDNAKTFDDQLQKKQNKTLLKTGAYKKIRGLLEPFFEEVKKENNQIIADKDGKVRTSIEDLDAILLRLSKSLLKDQNNHQKLEEILKSSNLLAKIILVEKLVNAVQYKKEEGKEAETDADNLRDNINKAVQDSYQDLSYLRSKEVSKIAVEGVQGGLKDKDQKVLMHLFKDDINDYRVEAKDLSGDFQKVKGPISNLKFSGKKSKSILTEDDFYNAVKFINQLKDSNSLLENITRDGYHVFTADDSAIKLPDNLDIMATTKSGRLELAIFDKRQEYQKHKFPDDNSLVKNGVSIFLKPNGSLDIGTIIHKKRDKNSVTDQESWVDNVESSDIDRVISKAPENGFFVKDNGETAIKDGVLKDELKKDKLKMFRAILDDITDDELDSSHTMMEKKSNRFYGNISEESFVVDVNSREAGIVSSPLDIDNIEDRAELSLDEKDQTFTKVEDILAKIKFPQPIERKIDIGSIFFQDSQPILSSQVQEGEEFNLDDLVAKSNNIKEIAKAENFVNILLTSFSKYGVGDPPPYFYDSICALKTAKKFYDTQKADKSFQDSVESDYINSLHKSLSRDLLDYVQEVDNGVIERLTQITLKLKHIDKVLDIIKKGDNVAKGVNEYCDKYSSEIDSLDCSFLRVGNKLENTENALEYVREIITERKQEIRHLREEIYDDYVDQFTRDINSRWSPASLSEKVELGSPEFEEEKDRLSVIDVDRTRKIDDIAVGPRKEIELFEEFKEDFEKSLTPRKYQIALGMLKRYCELGDRTKEFDQKFSDFVDNPEKFKDVVFDYSDFKQHQKYDESLAKFNKSAADFLAGNQDEMWKKLASFANDEAIYKDLLRIKRKFKISDNDNEVWQDFQKHYAIIFDEKSSDEQLSDSLSLVKETLISQRLKKWQGRLGDTLSEEKIKRLTNYGSSGLVFALQDENLVEAFGKEMIKKIQADNSILKRLFNSAILNETLGQAKVMELRQQGLDALQDKELIKFLGTEKITRIFSKFVALGKIDNVQDLKLRIKEKKIAEFNERFSDEFDVLNGISQTRTTGHETLFRGMDLSYINKDIDEQANYITDIFLKSNVPEPIAAKGKRQKTGSYNILTDREGSPVNEDDKRISFGVSTSFDVGVAIRYSVSANDKDGKGGWVFAIKPKSGEKGVRIFNRYKELCFAKINPEDIYAAYYVSPRKIKEVSDSNQEGEQINIATNLAAKEKKKQEFEIESLTIEKAIFNPNYEHDKSLVREGDKISQENIFKDYFGAELGEEGALKCIDKGDSEGFLIPLKKDEERLDNVDHQYEYQKTYSSNIEEFHKANKRPNGNIGGDIIYEDKGTKNEIHTKEKVSADIVNKHYRNLSNKALFYRESQDDKILSEYKLTNISKDKLNQKVQDSQNKLYNVKSTFEVGDDNKYNLSVVKDSYLDAKIGEIDNNQIDDSKKDTKKKELIRTEINKSLKEANRRASESYDDNIPLTNKEMALAILIANKNEGLGNKQELLEQDLKKLGYSADKIEDIRDKIVKFSAQFQNIVKDNLQTGNVDANNMVGLRLKRLPVSYVVGLFLDDFVENNKDEMQAKKDINNIFENLGMENNFLNKKEISDLFQHPKTDVKASEVNAVSRGRTLKRSVSSGEFRSPSPGSVHDFDKNTQVGATL